MDIGIQLASIAGFLPVMFLSIAAFWKQNAVLFMLTAGIAIVSGLSWYNLGGSWYDLTIGLCLFIYALLCLGYATKAMLGKGT